jgi:hypothetical protein
VTAQQKALKSLAKGFKSDF